MLSLSQIEEASLATRQFAIRTPVLATPSLAAMCEADASAPAPGEIWVKAENSQKTGSFKVRGAFWHLSQLSDEEKSRGVVCAGGNHAQGVALAAKFFGISATVFMPERAAIGKQRAARGYGADVHLEGRSYDESVIAAHAFEKRRRAVFVPSFDHDAIIAGHGSLGLELLEDMPDLNSVVIPIGGGGLFAGVARAIKERRPSVKIIGVQAQGADSAFRSFHAGHLMSSSDPVSTICDGIAVRSPSPRTFEYIQSLADEMVTVSDADVASTLLLLLERMKQVVEPAGAAGLAALLNRRTRLYGKTAVILCGGNVDLKLLSGLIERGMLKTQRYVHFMTSVVDQPGSLARLLETVAAQKGNLLTVDHNRISESVPLDSTGVELMVEVRDEHHREHLLEALRQKGYSIAMLD